EWGAGRNAITAHPRCCSATEWERPSPVGLGGRPEAAGRRNAPVAPLPCFRVIRRRDARRGPRPLPREKALWRGGGGLSREGEDLPKSGLRQIEWGRLRPTRDCVQTSRDCDKSSWEGFAPLGRASPPLGEAPPRLGLSPAGRWRT